MKVGFFDVGGLRVLSGSIYPETMGYKEAHWLVEPTGRGVRPASLVTVIKWDEVSGMHVIVGKYSILKIKVVYTTIKVQLHGVYHELEDQQLAPPT